MESLGIFLAYVFVGILVLFAFAIIGSALQGLFGGTTSSTSSGSGSSSSSNAGQIGIDNQGDLNLGLGGGVGIDLSDGSITFGTGSFHIDTDGK